MRTLLLAVFLYGISAFGQANQPIVWTKVWPPAGCTYPTCTIANGYEDIVWSQFGKKPWIYSTAAGSNGQPGGIYSSRLGYFDPYASSPGYVKVGDNGQTVAGSCIASSSTWPFTHHAVGQIWLDEIRHKLFIAQGVGCESIPLEEWTYDLKNPTSGTWTEVYPPAFATSASTTGLWAADTTVNSLTAAIASTGATQMTVALPTQAANGDFFLIDSEVVRVTAGGSPTLLRSGNVGSGANPLTITRGQYGTTAATHSNGAIVKRILGNHWSDKIVHDTYHDAYYWFGNLAGGSFGRMYVACDTSVNTTPGTLTSLQALVCSSADNWIDITSQSICADASACFASNEAGTNGTNSGKLPIGWYYPSMDYDPVLRQLVTWAGARGTIAQRYALRYNPETSTWTRITTTCSGAACTGLVNLVVSAAGSGYTSAPTVTISGCTGATATATLAGGAISYFTITNFGTACSSPTVGLSGGGGTGATGTAVANDGTGPAIYSNNGENIRVAHALYQSKIFYHLSQSSIQTATVAKYVGPVQDWALDTITGVWTELQSGAGSSTFGTNFTEAMTVDPNTGTLYTWGAQSAGGSLGEIWQGKITGAPNGSPGLGASTYNCADADGDGYGTGPGCLGPDADDSDATVKTAPEVLAKYGSLQAFWAHLGWVPGHVLFVDGGSGSCTKVAPPFVYSATTACGSIDTALPLQTDGDAIVVRAGTYNRTTAISLHTSNQSSSVCVQGFRYLLSYPGELPDFEYDGASSPSAINWFGTAYQSCVIIDGFKFIQNCLVDGSCPGSGGLGISNSGCSGCVAGSGSPVYGYVITHNDIGGFSDELHHNFSNFFTYIGHNYLHDALPGGDFGHVIYFSSDCPGGLNQPGFPGYEACQVNAMSTGTVIQGNVLANGWNTCLHINGPLQGVTIDSNLMSSCHKPILLQEGMNHSFITNNIAHTSGNQVFGIDEYTTQEATNVWQCHSMNYNVFANNTFFMDGQDYSQATYTFPYAGNTFGAGSSGAFAVNYILDEGSCGTSVTTTVNTTSGSTAITVASGTGISATLRNLVVGPGIPLGTYVSGGSGTSFTLSQAATATQTGVSLAFNLNASLASTANGSNVITVATTATDLSIWPGQYVVGSGIPAGTMVTATNAATVTLSQAATADATGVSVLFKPDVGHNVYANNIFVHSCGATTCIQPHGLTVTATLGSPNITTNTGSFVAVGETLVGTGYFPAGTTVLSGSGTSWTLSTNATASTTPTAPMEVLSTSSTSPGPIIKYSSPTLTATYLNSDIYVNNIFKNFDATASIIDPLGTGVLQDCTWFTNPVNVPLAAGNLCDTDPQLVSTNALWTNPSLMSNWNLKVQAGSAALNSAFAPKAAIYDALGVSRDPSIGAYEASGGPTPPGPPSVIRGAQSGAISVSGSLTH